LRPGIPFDSPSIAEEQNDEEEENPMKRMLTSLALCGALLIAAVVPVVADSPVLSRIVQNGELRVGMSGSQPPFTVKSKDGSLIGYEVDLAKLLANAMNVELKLVEMPFGELLGALEAGKVDVVMSGMTMTPERNLKAAFVGPYIVSGKSILTKDQTLAQADEAGDIDQADLTIVALENSTSQKFVEALMPKAKLMTTKQYDDGVAMVLDDKATAMVADFPICALSVMRYGDQGLVTLAEPLTIEPIGIAISPGDSLLLNMIENYLGALEVVGVLSELESKWFESGDWLIQLP
jgi:polar amino acid transport system substrate-binding protein